MYLTRYFYLDIEVLSESLHVLCGCIPLDRAQICVQTGALLRGVDLYGGLQDFESSTRLPPWSSQKVRWNVFTGANRSKLEIIIEGSKIGGKVGCACEAYRDRNEIHFEKARLGNFTSVFMAEVCAIKMAVEFIVKANLPGADILSDLRSALLAMESVSQRQKIIIDIKTMIISYNYVVRLFWVRAHKGLEGNVRADVLAKEPTCLTDIEFHFNQSVSSQKQAIKKQFLLYWQNRWNVSVKGQRTLTVSPKN